MKPTAAQTNDTLAQITQLAARLRILEPNLRRSAADSNLDGYPRQSGGGGSSGGGHGDPVGMIVALRIDHPHRDPLAYAHAAVVANLHEARRLLEEAESLGRRTLPSARSASAAAFDDGCVSCARIKTWSPIHRTRRCHWCSDWAYAHGGEDPPIDILRAHHQGRRITTRLVDRLWQAR